MEGKKVFVNKKGMASIVCHQCHEVKNVTVDKFKGVKYQLNVKCPCGNVFTVTLDFRQQYRKTTALIGYLKVLGKTGGNSPAPATAEEGKTRGLECLIINLSMTGLRLQLREAGSTLAVGMVLQLLFTLDDKAKTEIDREVVVKNIKDNTFGCEYTDPDLFDKIMGFYLLP